ncbi:MAG: GAF domain-containing protein, partial [Pleurocapsa sp.]
MHDQAKCNQADSNSFVSQRGNVCQDSKSRKSEMTVETQKSQGSEESSHDDHKTTSNSYQKPSGAKKPEVLTDDTSPALTTTKEAKLNQLRQRIIQTILSYPDDGEILSHAAREIGVFCQVEACAVISLVPCCVNSSGDSNSLLRTTQAPPLQIAWWYEKEFTVEEQNYWRSQLNNLFTGDTTQEFDNLAAARTYFLQVTENLVGENLTTKTILVTLTCYHERVNGAILLFHNLSHCWTNSEQELLDNISETMAIAISQVQLQQQNQTKTKYQD